MTFDTVNSYALSHKSAKYDYPFDDKVRTYRIGKKIFALMSHEEPLRINLKCDPVYALELRNIYDAVIAGYHMNKKHWNTVSLEGDVDEALLQELITDSYNLVLKSLPKKEQILLQN